MQNGNDTGQPPFAAFDVVVVAASAGGVQALLPFVQNLPTDFPIAVVVVLHLPPTSRHISCLPEILQRKTQLGVKWAEDREPLLSGNIYVAPQDRSTVIDAETGCLSVSPPKAFTTSLPAADPLFCSAAQRFGSRTLAVVLSGVLSDGAAGAAMIAQAGGRVLAQTASDAQFGDMPRAAMRRSRVGLAFASISLAQVIGNLVMVPGAAAWFGIGKAGVGAGLLRAS